MVICGIKVTHDASIALIDNGVLAFSLELEKIGNRHRHSPLAFSWHEIRSLLRHYGYSLEKVDRFAFDGWLPNGKHHYYPVNAAPPAADYLDLELAGYGSLVGSQNILSRTSFFSNSLNVEYSSYLHVSSHVFSAYCTSPFARRNEDSFILVWDGGMPPQLFYYHYASNRVENLGHLIVLVGLIYAYFPRQFSPFANAPHDMSIPGKAMAFLALGEVREELVDEFGKAYDDIVTFVEENQLKMDTHLIGVVTREFLRRTKAYGDDHQYQPADMMASYHAFIERVLIRNLERAIVAKPTYAPNLCFAGGCALNIKWNSSVRSNPLIKEMWVPPFPNDSGSAIGVACCEMVNSSHRRSLDWQVYTGPTIPSPQSLPDGWDMQPCTPSELADLLFETSEPVVVLNDHAELGPRALGNRSILAVPTCPSMKDKLNEIKGRESYRPVAPICLESDAPTIFSPGTPDPFMLYEHTVRAEWRSKIPAVCHIDNTARLQTVNQSQHPVMHELLQRYKQRSGIPLLCNTSANFKGRGFFPDVESAMKWGKVKYIWSAGKLYVKRDA